MTLIYEEKWALENTRLFLRSLLIPKETPRVPMSVRREARRCLKHYPFQCNLDRMFEWREKNDR